MPLFDGSGFCKKKQIQNGLILFVSFLLFLLFCIQSNTGIAVDDECVKAFNELKLSKKSKYLVFNLNDKATAIVLEKTGGKEEGFDTFLASLPKDDTRYAVIDFEYDTPDGGRRNKLVFVNWAPESAKIKRKMLFAGSKSSLKDKLVGLSFEIQATDASEVSEKVILEKALTFK